MTTELIDLFFEQIAKFGTVQAAETTGNQNKQGKKSSEPEHALMRNRTARHCGGMSCHGNPLAPVNQNMMTCYESGFQHCEEEGDLRCLDLVAQKLLPQG